MWKSKTHGMTKTRIYKMWQNMKSRCNCPSASKYNIYGGRGIKVCDEWQHDFMAFYTWAVKNGYRDDLTIDRIDGNGNYCPENCRFATYAEQNNHLSTTVFLTYNGETHSLKDWANITGISHDCLSARYLRKWDTKRLLTEKSNKIVKRDEITGRFIKRG